MHLTPVSRLSALISRSYHNVFLHRATSVGKGGSGHVSMCQDIVVHLSQLYASRAWRLVSEGDKNAKCAVSLDRRQPPGTISAFLMGWLNSCWQDAMR